MKCKTIKTRIFKSSILNESQKFEIRKENVKFAIPRTTNRSNDLFIPFSLYSYLIFYDNVMIFIEFVYRIV